MIHVWSICSDWWRWLVWSCLTCLAQTLHAAACIRMAKDASTGRTDWFVAEKIRKLCTVQEWAVRFILLLSWTSTSCTSRRLEKIENAILFARFFGHCWLWCWGFLTEHTLIDNITMPKLAWHESQAFALELGVGGALVDVAGLSARTGEEDCHGVMQVRNASEIKCKKCMKETWWVCVPMCSKSAWDRSFEDCFVLDFKTGPSPWSSTHLWSEANVCHVNLPWSPVSRRQVPV